MSDRRVKIARAIEAFLDHPVTNLVNGLALLAIGAADASRTFFDDFATGRFRAGHGLILIGLFSTLRALPHFLEGLEASERYLKTRQKEIPAESDGDLP